MGKARSLQGHRAPVGRGDHLKREGGAGGSWQRVSLREIASFMALPLASLS